MKISIRELKERAEQAIEISRHCALCPRRCGVNRPAGETGFCRTKLICRIAAALPHYGEEPPISGSKGAGTIFFSSCNLRCVYCQNYQISHLNQGFDITSEELAMKFLSLQNEGCHNLELVSPSHQIVGILKAIQIAVQEGFQLPIVYNTNGYEELETLKMLDGIVDIYLPDFKYFQDEMAEKYSSVSDYVENTKIAIKEMFRQVGYLKVNEDGIAIKGLIIRHLVLPQNISGTIKILKWIAEDLSPEVHISLMAQYYPIYKAKLYPEINRRITDIEYEMAIDFAEALGLNNVWIQDLTSAPHYVPDFQMEDPFDIKQN